MEGGTILPKVTSAHTLQRSRESMEDEVLSVKRNYILVEAVNLFYERGYQGATLDALAQRLGVTKPFIYSHYKNKEAILIEVCERGVITAINVADEALASSGRPTERLRNMIQKFTMVVLEHQRNVTVYFRESKKLPDAAVERIVSLRGNLDHKLARLLEEGTEAGEFEIEDSQLTAVAMRGMVSWAYTWYQPLGRPTQAEVSDKMAQLALNMVRAK